MALHSIASHSEFASRPALSSYFVHTSLMRMMTAAFLAAFGMILFLTTPAAAQTGDFVGIDTYAVPITIGGTTHVVTVTVSAGSILEMDATTSNLVIGSPIRLSSGAQPNSSTSRSTTILLLPSVRSTANLRSGPGTTQTVIGSARAGDSLDIIGISADGQWYALASGAWIATSLVQDAPARSTLTVITAPPSGAQAAPAVQPVATSTTRTVAVPTPTPVPAAAPQGAGGSLAIVSLDKGAEFAVIQNVGSTAVSLDGWILRSERGMQDCALRGTLEAGARLTISAMGQQAGFNCAFESNIWNNSEPDAAVLIGPGGAEMDRLE